MKTKGFLCILIGLGFLGVSFLVPISGNAAEYTVDLAYETTDQSMWGPGQAIIFDYERFWGPQWDEYDESRNVGYDPIFGTPWGGTLYGETSGRIGIEVDIHFDSGSVNVTYPVGIALEYPDLVCPGETFAISSSYVVLPGASMTTNFTEASLYAAAIVELYAAIGGQFATGFWWDPIHVPLINIDEELVLVDIGTGQTASWDIGGFGSVEATIPDIDTTGTLVGDRLESEGEDDFLELMADLDGIATGLLGAPPLEGSVDLLVAEAWYNIFDFEAGLAFAATQDFVFDPNLVAYLELETGDVIPLEIGSSVDILYPTECIGGTLDITPTFVLNNAFSNDTGMRIDPQMEMEVLSAGLDIAIVGEISVGPVYEWDWRAPGPPIGLYSNTFALQGFDEFTTADFSVKPVPEPATLLLVGSGVLMGAAFGRRRRKRKSTQ